MKSRISTKSRSVRLSAYCKITAPTAPCLNYKGNNINILSALVERVVASSEQAKGEKMRAPILTALLVLGIAGCATPYKPNGLGGGYEDVQLAADTYRVSARGNGYTDPQRVHDIVLLRSSEIALSRGYQYFTIVQSADGVRTSSFVTPGSMQTNTTGFATGSGMATASGNTAFASGTAFGSSTSNTTFTPPMVHMINRPNTEIMIKLIADPSQVQGQVYDANLISASLGPKLK